MVFGRMFQVNQSSNVIANCINGVSGESNTSYFWKDHFSTILNSTGSCNDKLKNSIMTKLEKVRYNENMIVCSTTVIARLIGKLESGKSSGPDDISSESLKFANN